MGSLLTVDILLASKSACVGLLCQTLAHLEELQMLVSIGMPCVIEPHDPGPLLILLPPAAPVPLTLATGASAASCFD